MTFPVEGFSNTAELFFVRAFPHLDTTSPFSRSTISETKLIALNSPAQTASNLNLAIFRSSAAESIGRKAVSLFPGIGFGAAYKILQVGQSRDSQKLVLRRSLHYQFISRSSYL
jgi:hypothetical protein